MALRQAAILVSCAFVAACDISFLIVSPSAVVVAGEPHLALRPLQPFPQTVPFSTCPVVHPFQARFEAVISGNRTDHDLEQIDVSFADRRGVAGTNLSLSRGAISQQFGTTRVAAGHDRVLVIVLGVGCGTLSAGTIVVRVYLRDGTGSTLTIRDEIVVG
jgi:hypothetical protein